MACDTPARIAVVGAGPIGLEAALYARFLGYEVIVIERGRLAENVARLAEENPAKAALGTFADLHSPLGRAAIESQDEGYVAPAGDESLSAAAWLERYLKPLAASDLLDGCFRMTLEALEISPLQVADEEAADETEGDDEAPAPNRFAIRCRSHDGQESVEQAAVVVDTAGLGLSTPNFALRRLSQGDWAAEDFIQSAPHYYLLGAAAIEAGELSFADGLRQIRLLFSLIGGRDGLDLYAGASSLLRKR